MRPILFECIEEIPIPATEICVEIATLSRWPEFKGYGFLPGIAAAEYEVQTSNMIATRIRVRNTDGSGHIEEICEWEPGKKIVMKLHHFTPPLNRLATHFIEEWNFEAANNSTMVRRSFQLFAARSVTRPFLWLISLFLKRAIVRHLAEMKRNAQV